MSSSSAPDPHAPDAAAPLVIQQIVGHGDVAPERVALIHPVGDAGWGRLTYGALATRVRHVAAGLARRGVVRGARVVVLVPMSPELYVVLLAVASLGAVAVFVEPAATPREMARAIRVTHPVAFIGVPKAHVLRLMFPRDTATGVSIVVGGGVTARLLGAEPLAAVEADGAATTAPIFPELAGTDPALLTFSSGSTGTPKGAVRSHAFLGAQHDAMAGLLDAAGRTDGTPDVHMSAFAIVLLSTLVSGHTAVIPRLGRGVDDIDGAALARAIRDLGVTVISGSPAFLAPIFDAADRGPRPGPLAGVRRIISGGAPVPVELCEQAGRLLDPSATFLVVYGSTEAEPISRIDAAEVRAAQTQAAARADALVTLQLDPPHRLAGHRRRGRLDRHRRGGICHAGRLAAAQRRL
ncbi:MAG: AMP-binding protein, partial [Myxococcales bacterium]|nr:AMP-binding protein [Myxococcales bacterium]